MELKSIRFYKSGYNASGHKFNRFAEPFNLDTMPMGTNSTDSQENFSSGYNANGHKFDRFARKLLGLRGSVADWYKLSECLKGYRW